MIKGFHSRKKKLDSASHSHRIFREVSSFWKEWPISLDLCVHWGEYWNVLEYQNMDQGKEREY